jgi:hypothetical protein
MIRYVLHLEKRYIFHGFAEDQGAPGGIVEEIETGQINVLPLASLRFDPPTEQFMREQQMIAERARAASGHGR